MINTWKSDSIFIWCLTSKTFLEGQRCCAPRVHRRGRLRLFRKTLTWTILSLGTSLESNYGKVVSILLNENYVDSYWLKRSSRSEKSNTFSFVWASTNCSKRLIKCARTLVSGWKMSTYVRACLFATARTETLTRSETQRLRCFLNLSYLSSSFSSLRVYGDERRRC